MPKRRFDLPGIQDLSKEQDEVLALPKQGQHLVVGGPGTGKSVVTLIRARRHREDGDEYVFLVYNRLLHQASGQLFGKNLAAHTWLSWFFSLFRAATGQEVPLLPSEAESRWQDVDWREVLSVVQATDIASPPSGLPFLLIDEGQDMPKEFYEALVNLGFENFFVAADSNQTLDPRNNSKLGEIANSLGIVPGRWQELRYNYRNSHPVALLARHFWQLLNPQGIDAYTGSPPPDLPPGSRTSRKPVLVTYDNPGGLTFDKLIQAILKAADRDPRQLIGVITQNNRARSRYVEALSRIPVTLDNGRPRIQTYASGDSAALAFDEGGIMVINANSCKGLEFDTVFLADIHEYRCTPRNQDAVIRLFYVMVARSRGHIVLLNKHGVDCPVAELLPKDDAALDRWG